MAVTRTTPRRRTTRRGAPTNLTPSSAVLSGGGSAANPRFQEYWGVSIPAAQSPTGRTIGGHALGTTGGYQQYRRGYNAGFGQTPAAAPALTGSSGGGGRGYGGGGGGGGGGSAMTQAMFDMMLSALGTRGPQLSLQQVDLPNFTGQNLPAFSGTVYDNMLKQIAGAVAADQAAIQSSANQATTALGAYNANPYAAAAAAPPPQAQAQGVALQGTAGGTPGADANAAAAQQVNAGAGAETAAFNDLLRVLGANYGQAQNSRMGEVQLNAQSARNQLGAQNRALTGQVGQARTQAYEAWRQADAERRYQNSLMAQQWQREEMMRNQEIANQQAQGRWQQSNEMISNRLTPLLELLAGTQGANINTGALQRMLKQWAA